MNGHHAANGHAEQEDQEVTQRTEGIDPQRMRETSDAFSEQAKALADLVEPVLTAARQVSTGDSALDNRLRLLAETLAAEISEFGENDVQNAATMLAQLLNGHSGQEHQ